MVYVHFALGKALEDVGDYRRAFEHLLQGNALKRREIQYDEAVSRRNFQADGRRFDRSLLERFAGAGDPVAGADLYVGMPRSGSTLVEQILASHPQVHAAGELTNLNRVVRMMCPSAVPVRRAAPTPTAGGDWARLIWQACRRWPTAKHGSPTSRRAIFFMSV